MPIVQVNNYGFNAVVGGHSPSFAGLPVRGVVSPVRRRLFVSDDEQDDHQLVHRLTVERQLVELQREQTRQWNFDFEHGVPLAGRYLWQPSVVTLPDRPSHPLPPPAGIKRPIDNPIDSTGPRRSKQMKPDVHIYDDSINNNHRCVTQKKITDFMKNQKLNDSKRRDATSVPSSNGLGH